MSLPPLYKLGWWFRHKWEKGPDCKVICGTKVSTELPSLGVCEKLLIAQLMALSLLRVERREGWKGRTEAGGSVASYLSTSSLTPSVLFEAPHLLHYVPHTLALEAPSPTSIFHFQPAIHKG